MALVNLKVETEQQIFGPGTIPGGWGFWVNDLFCGIVAGPRITPNEYTVFEIIEDRSTDQIYVAHAVRVDICGNSLGPQKVKVFTLGEADIDVIVTDDDGSTENAEAKQLNPFSPKQ